jgi:hypothetical protein
LNAEGAKGSQRTQKRRKEEEKMNTEWMLVAAFDSSLIDFLFLLFGFLLRPLRTLRALCVQNGILFLVKKRDRP